MCRFLHLRRGKSPSRRRRSQRLLRASVLDRNRKLLTDHLTSFVICERVRCASATHESLNRPAGLSLPKTAALIWTAATCPRTPKLSPSALTNCALLPIRG